VAAGSAVRANVRIVADPEKLEQTEKPRPEDPDVQQLQELYDLMQRESLENLELKNKNSRIRLDRAHRPSAHDHPVHHRPAHSLHPAHPAPAPNTTGADSIPAGQSIKAPLAGVFYRAASPTSNPYVQAGAVAEPGQTLCLIEAMKVMNEIKAEHRCKIVKILAENSRPVSAGQALFLVEPA
jgi:acetyl-CoA carboxylase biotin carboxyl carrier protein